MDKKTHKKKLMSIPTAEEFLKQCFEGYHPSQYKDLHDVQKERAEYAIIEYAKLHVEAALKAAELNVKLLVDNNEEYRELDEAEDLLNYYECGSDTVRVSSSSILNSYPLNNIK